MWVHEGIPYGEGRVCPVKDGREGYRNCYGTTSGQDNTAILGGYLGILGQAPISAKFLSEGLS